MIDGITIDLHRIGGNGQREVIATVGTDELARDRVEDIHNARDRRACAERMAAKIEAKDSAADFLQAIDDRAATEVESKPEPAPHRFPPPIRLDTPRVPELPEGIFIGWLGEFIDASARATETPRELPATFSLAAVSTVCAKRFSVLVTPGYFEPTNIWLCCSMDPGNRKTEAEKKSISPLAEWEQQQAAELLPAIEKATSERKTTEARITRLRADAAKAKAGDFGRLKAEIAELEAALPDIPRPQQRFTQDVTPEHTGTMLAENDERLALISDEGGLFDIMGGRYSSGIPNLDVYLQSHAGAPVRVNRGSRPPVNLKHPALTIAISPQLEVCRGLTANRAFRGRGLLARFVYMIPPSRLGYRSGNTAPIPDAVANAYRAGIFALAAVQPAGQADQLTPHVLSLRSDAHELWHSFWLEVEAMMKPGGRLEHVTDWGGKLPGLVARIAGLLHCADYASCATEVRDIEPGTMERAIRFGRYIIEHALAAFDLMGADPAMDAARDLWKVIEKNRKERFTVRDAWHPLRGKYRRTADAEAGFDVLIDYGYIVEPNQPDHEQRRSGRPPGRLFVVNPVLMEGWA